MKLFSKLKDYNQILESVLEKKYFSSNIKNLWLSMIYKLEIAYNDFYEVKRSEREKDEFLQEIIDAISEYCEHIQVVEPDTKDAEILKKNNVYALTNSKEKSMLVYPTEVAFLYAISDIIPKYYYINKEMIFRRLLQNALVEGYNYNNLSILFDFNGWSWDNSPKKNTPFISNLVYQNLLLLFGEKFLNNWRNSSSSKTNYYEDLKYKIQSLDKDNTYIHEILKLLYNSADVEEKDKLEDVLIEKRELYVKMQDNQKYLQEIKIDKKKKIKRIEEIDKILNDDDLLIAEFEKANKKLDNDKKISKIKIFVNMLKNERIDCTEKIKELSNLQNPILYLKIKSELEDAIQIYTNEEKISSLIIKSQIEFLKLFEKNLSQIDNNVDIINSIYKLRFYKKLNITNSKKIEDIKAVEKYINKIFMEITIKACKLGVLKTFSNNDAINFYIIKKVFDTNIIELTEANILLKTNKEKDKLGIEILDKDIFEKEYWLDMKDKKIDINVKFNKKNKLFT